MQPRSRFAIKKKGEPHIVGLPSIISISLLVLAVQQRGIIIMPLYCADQ